VAAPLVDPERITRLVGDLRIPFGIVNALELASAAAEPAAGAPQAS
jgi:hypothetical protein